MSSAAPPPPAAAALATARAALGAARRDRAALSAQLRSLRCAADLAAARPPRDSPPAAAALEARLLAAASAASAARARVRARRADAAARRARAAGPLSPGRRGAARRSIAEIDALVALAPGAELLPCHVTVSAACVVTVLPVARAAGAGGAGEDDDDDPVLTLRPPFAPLAAVAPLAAAGPPPPDFARWLAALPVRACPPHGTAAAPMRLVGLRGAVRDARALVRAHAASPFAVAAAPRSPPRPAGEATAAARTIASGLSARLGALGLRRPGAAAAADGGAADGAADEGAADGAAGVERTAGERTTSPPASPPPSTPPTLRRRGRGGSGGAPADAGAVAMVGGESAVLTAGAAGRLMAAAPARFAGSSLRLLYSTRVHGTSLLSLYARGAGESPTVLALRDAGGARFGCFATAPWQRSAKPTYYGTGESFCWRAAAGGAEGEPAGESVDVYVWSRGNSYFQCSTATYLAFGGGGHFAVRLDDDLQRGSSGDCDTFGSPCLATATEFDCVVLELWALDSSAWPARDRG